MISFSIRTGVSLAFKLFQKALRIHFLKFKLGLENIFKIVCSLAIASGWLIIVIKHLFDDDTPEV